MTRFPSNTVFSSLGFSGLGKEKHQQKLAFLKQKKLSCNISGRNVAWNKKNHQLYWGFLNFENITSSERMAKVYEKNKKTGKLRWHYEKRPFQAQWPPKDEATMVFPPQKANKKKQN